MFSLPNATMKSDVILSSTSLPIFLLLLLGGLYLSFRTGWVQLRYPFLSLKVLAGALDWKGSRGKITPGRAFFAGTLGSLVPGTLAGSVFALVVSGPGIFPLLWAIHILQSSAEFILATSTLRTRDRGHQGRMQSSLVLAAEKLTRIRWVGLLYAAFFAATSLVAGSIINVYLLAQVAGPLRATIPLPGPLGLSVGLLVAVVLVTAGGIRRISLIGKYSAFISIFALLVGIIALACNPPTQTATFVRSLLDGPFSRGDMQTTALSVAIYFALAEFGNGRLALISGLVRTDHAAKQGLAALLFPMFQIGLSFLVGALAFDRLDTSSLQAESGNLLNTSMLLLDRFFGSVSALQMPEGGWMAPIAHLLTGVILLLLMLSTVTWLYAGNMTFRHLLRGRLPNIFPAVSVLLVLTTGLLSETGSQLASIIFSSYLALALFTTLFAVLLAVLFARSARQELVRYQNSREGRGDISRDLYLMFMQLIPANLVSRAFGWFSLIRFPRPIQNLALQLFAKAYRINLEEAALPLESYPSLNAFFTRELKPGVRPIDTGRRIIISPVDARLSRMGRIQEGLLIQAKGIYYNLKDLIGDAEIAPRFQNGHYCVLYLSPQDYHRIHTPFQCEVVGYTYSPGQLFPVNDLAVHGVYGLFPKNERLTSILRTKHGHIAMIKVGAVNVGKIRVTYDSVRTNTWFRRRKAHLYFEPPTLDKGAEIGRFEMGSTVILLFEPDTMEFLSERFEGEKVKLGQGIGRFR